MAITFDDPPLNEVALGRTFLPRQDFLVPYYGAFWALVREDYPRVAHAPPIIMPNEQPVVGDDGALLPRIWLLSKDSMKLVQLQQNRFHFNWRQTSETEKQEYVRFPAIRTECVRLWRLFEEFVSETTGQPLKPTSSELTYTNLLTVDNARDAFEVTEGALIDADWSRHARFLPLPTHASHSYTFTLPEDLGVLLVSTAGGKRKDGSPVVKLDLTVRGRATDSKPFDQWATAAHDYLVAAFKDLTRPAMHAVWKLRED